ncbi:MAG: extracellular solute-binding protein [Oscillospiraceae bacterium]|nr:extracellular solute-binding protein [Oscillospiraceae bacterium]
MCKRIFCLILIIVFFISCGSETIKNTENKTTESVSETVIDYNTLYPEKPYDFDGYEFRAFITGPGAGDYEQKEIYSEVETGEVLNDAVRMRNVLIEDKFNFKITVIIASSFADLSAKARKSILTGDDEYDMVMPVISQASSLAQDKLLLDLNIVPGLYLEAPWWDQNANDQLTIYDKLYFTTGDIGVLDKYCTLVTFFNKKLITDFNLENPYELVNTGKWTQDKLYEMMRSVSMDLNGDGVMDYEDRWGILADRQLMFTLFYGAGEHVTKKSKDGGLDITILNNRSINVMENVYKFYDKDHVIYADDIKSNHATVWNAATTMFCENRALFRICALIFVNEQITRESEIDFGVLPTPKYNIEQDGYFNHVSTIAVPGVCVPITVPIANLERVGVIIDAMARYAGDTVQYAFYDKILNNRLIRDTESSAMLDLIFSTTSYDLGRIYNFGGIFNVFGNTALGGRNFVSDCESLMEKAITELDKILEMYRAEN